MDRNNSFIYYELILGLLTIAWKTFSFTSEGVWKFLLEHTMLYITSSPINLDEWLNYPAIKPDSTMLSVFII